MYQELRSSVINQRVDKEQLVLVYLRSSGTEGKTRGLTLVIISAEGRLSSPFLLQVTDVVTLALGLVFILLQCSPCNPVFNPKIASFQTS